MSNLDKTLKLAEDAALKCVGATGFSFENDRIVDAFGMIKKIMLEVDAVAAKQAEAEAQAERARLEAEAEVERARLEAEAEAAEEWFSLVDSTFKKWDSRFLLKMGKKQRFIALFGDYATSDEAGAAFSQLLAPLGDIDIWKKSVTVDQKEVYLWLINLRGLNLCRHLIAAEHGGYQEEMSQGIYAVRNRLVDYLQ